MKKTLWRLFSAVNLKLSSLMSAAEDDHMGTRRNAEHRILVIGKAGNGKSSVCNTIVGDERFQTGRSLTVATKTAQYEYVSKQGQDIRVVDTPDVTNTNMTRRQMEEEVAKWKELTYPYPTAVLLTVRCDVRYTAEEHAIYRKILSLWGDNSLIENLVVAFTFGDRQDTPIDEELELVNDELTSVLENAGRHYFVFDNKANRRDEQAPRLLDYLETKMRKDETSVPKGSAYLPRVLGGVAGVAGLGFAASYTASKTGWAAGFGLLFLVAGISFVYAVLRNKRKMP